MFNLIHKQYESKQILLESQIKALKEDLERLRDDFKRFKGYVYNKKIHMDQEDQIRDQEVLIPATIGAYDGKLF